MSTFAGTGDKGFGGDGGSALNAVLSGPTGLVSAPDGTLFVSDSDNHVVRAITADGNIRTVAGTRHPGFDGDGGSALKAELNTPAGLALASTGQLYIADSGNNRIRRIDGDGTITTVAGSKNGPVFGGPATGAHLYGPRGISLDGEGNLLIADTRNNVVRRVDSKGIITTVAGGSFPVATTFPAPASKAYLVGPESIAVLADGSLLLPSPLGILSLSPDRTTVSAFVTAVGLGPLVFSDGQGRAYTTGYGVGVIWRVSSKSSTPEHFAGQSWSGTGSEGDTAKGSTLSTPRGMAVGKDGTVFVADRDNHRLLKISPGSTIHTIARVGDPEFVTVDADGTAFVSDYQVIRKVTPQGDVSILAGGGVSALPFPGSAPVEATSVHFEAYGLVAHPDGNLYAFVQPSLRASAIVKISPAGTLSTLVLPNRLEYYHGLSLDAQGNLLLGSSVFSNGTTIFRIDTSGNFLTGLGGVPALDGYITEIAAGPSGAIFTVDSVGRIKQASADNLFVSIFNRDLSDFIGNTINIGLATDNTGNLYFSEGDLHRIRRLDAGSCKAQAGPVISAVVNSANFDSFRSPVGFAPGELISIFGYFMGPQTGIAATVGSAGTFPFSLAGVRVLFEDEPGIVLYASAGQLNTIVPFTMYGRDTVRIQVEKDGIKSDAFTLTLTESSPSIYSLNGSGDVRSVTVFNQDGSLNSQTNPAAPGSVVVAYATGLGRTDPPGKDGHLATFPYPKPRLPLTASSGPVQYAGDAPGLVEGMSQINFLAPDGPSGRVTFHQGDVTFEIYIWVR